MTKRYHFFPRFAAALLLISMMLSLCACGLNAPESVKAGHLTQQINPKTVKGKAADTAFVASQYAFAAELLKASYADDRGNCLISPLSAELALAMTANGAAGETLSQMLDVIGGGLPLEDLNAYLYEYVNSLPVKNGKSKLAIANSLWLNDVHSFSVKDDFLRDVVSYYGADIYKLPFNSEMPKEINGWVSEKTDKMIKKIVEDVGPDARMFLINAVCFDGKWVQPFTGSQKAPFTDADGNELKADMMYSEETTYYEGDGYTGFAKYYENGCRFVALLPDEKTGLADLIAGLDGAKLSAILSGGTGDDVIIGLPKFSYEYEASFKERLKELGMRDAFAINADFSRMSEEPLFIDGVLQKTFIEVTEAGTKAAAVTAVTMAAKAIAGAEPKRVTLDRPFLYMIVDNEHSLPIFIGTVETVK